LLEKDLNLLESLDEYRILTVSQLAHLHGRTRQMARRRLHVLRNTGLLGAVLLANGRRGRPEQVFFLSKSGADLIAERRPNSSPDASDRPLEQSIHFLRHDLLVNWFKIHLARIDEILPGIKTVILSNGIVSKARIHTIQAGASSGERRRASGGKSFHFIPDGVFALLDAKTKKTFLFFLEVDMGTRPVSSFSDSGRDAREKIITYQEYFLSGGYKAYERVLGSTLTGFRLLFLADSQARLSGLCLLIATLTGTEFVWVTDRERMFTHGLAAAIWIAGGDT